MKRPLVFLILLLLCCAIQPIILGSDTKVSDPYIDVFAARQMRGLDKDGDGRFVEEESERNWSRKHKLDTNQDGAITLEELKKEKIAYLDSAGEKKLNILYKRTVEEDLYLDLYYPTAKRTDKRPIVVYTHGGGWGAGNKQGASRGSFAVVFKKLLAEGFCVVSVNYRLYQKGGTVAMRDCVIDSKDAIRYLSKHRGELGVDPQRVYSFGDSAGGQIAQMLLLSSPASLPGDPALAGASYKMVAGVSWYGPCDFEKTDLFNHDDRADFKDRFGARILLPDTDEATKISLYREMSPINFLKKESPPLMILQGDMDTTIPVKHAYYIQEKATAIDAPVEVLIIKNAGHNWREADGKTPIEPSRGEIEERTIDFIVNHL